MSDNSPAPEVFGLLLLGDVIESWGLAVFCNGVPACESCRWEAGVAVSVLILGEDGLLILDFFSASRLSMALRSLRPASSSVIRPDIFSNCSILPSRFSSPSIYLALHQGK